MYLQKGSFQLLPSLNIVCTNLYVLIDIGRYHHLGPSHVVVLESTYHFPLFEAFRHPSLAPVHLVDYSGSGRFGVYWGLDFHTG